MYVPSVNKWISILRYSHKMEYYSAPKKELGTEVCRNVNDPHERYAKGRKPAQKVAHCMIPFTVICPEQVIPQRQKRD